MTDFIHSGDIRMIDLPACGKYCINGPHPCLVYLRVGSNWEVIPISEDKGDLHWCEYSIEKGRCGLRKNSKLKFDGRRPISCELIGKKLIGRADLDVYKALNSYIEKEKNHIDRLIDDIKK